MTVMFCRAPNGVGTRLEALGRGAEQAFGFNIRSKHVEREHVTTAITAALNYDAGAPEDRVFDGTPLRPDVKPFYALLEDGAREGCPWCNGSGVMRLMPSEGRKFSNGRFAIPCTQCHPGKGGSVERSTYLVFYEDGAFYGGAYEAHDEEDAIAAWIADEGYGSKEDLPKDLDPDAIEARDL
jgi:hypothetical protein